MSINKLIKEIRNENILFVYKKAGKFTNNDSIVGSFLDRKVLLFYRKRNINVAGKPFKFSLGFFFKKYKTRKLIKKLKADFNFDQQYLLEVISCHSYQCNETYCRLISKALLAKQKEEKKKNYADFDDKIKKRNEQIKKDFESLVKSINKYETLVLTIGKDRFPRKGYNCLAMFDLKIITDEIEDIQSIALSETKTNKYEYKKISSAKHCKVHKDKILNRLSAVIKLFRAAGFDYVTLTDLESLVLQKCTRLIISKHENTEQLDDCSYSEPFDNEFRVHLGTHEEEYREELGQKAFWNKGWNNNSWNF